LRRYFVAEAAGLFYVDGLGRYRFCPAGAGLPISLSEERWKSCLARIPLAPSVGRFGPWSMPVFESVCAFWIGSELYASGGNRGYILLGRSASDWSGGDEADLSAIAEAIGPIVGVRIEREQEAFERAEAEAHLARNDLRMRDFFENSRDMIYTSDAADTITSINAAGLLLLDLHGKEEAIGRPVKAFALNPGDRDLFLRRIVQDGFVDDYEIVLTRGGGGPVFCIETAIARRGADGALEEVQGIVKDISDRIEREREMWRVNLELAEANIRLSNTRAVVIQQEKLASIGQLAAGIAHEINNPLGFLLSNNATLERDLAKIRRAWDSALAAGGERIEEIVRREVDPLIGELAEIFAESREGFKRIAGIVSSLKVFARADRGLEFDSYDVNEGIESALVIAWNEIKYVAEVKKELGNLPRIRARAGEINQVVLNILINAAQAIGGQNRPEKGLIEISSRDDGEFVRIEIRDDGPGIPESARGRIFEPFFTTKAPGKGTGLGLSISYDIVVAKHRGRLAFESTLSRGTTFVLELPIQGPPPQDAGCG